MRKRKIYQYTTKGEFVDEFLSITAAANFFEKDESTIRKVVDEFPDMKACGYFWSSEKTSAITDMEEEEKKEIQKDFPKILILDIETAPLKGYVWRLWKQNIYKDQLIDDWFMLSWSAKWLYSSVVFSERLTGREAVSQDDSRIVKSLWKAINEADIIVAHNGNKFDIPKIKNRFLIHGLFPPSPFKSVDTKIIAKVLGFSSNSLDSINRALGLERKLDTDFDLWVRCLEGDEEALKYMNIYCDQDIESLEQAYIRLRPWMGPYHPNVGLYMETNKSVCYVCGSTRLNPDGYYYTSVGKYSTYQCMDCGAHNRVRRTEVIKDKSKNLVRSIAKH